MRRKSEAIEFDLEHVPRKSEPLLWVPDQILGAYGEVATKGPTGAGRARGKGQSGRLRCTRRARDSARAGAHETQDCRLSLPFPLGVAFSDGIPSLTTHMSSCAGKSRLSG